MFQIRQAGVKGLGIFACQDISRGGRILTELPLLSINRSQPDILVAAQILATDRLLSLLKLSSNEGKPASIASFCAAAWKSITTASSVSIQQNKAILEIFHNNNFALFDKAGTRAVF